MTDSIVILSPTMQAFIESDVPIYGNKTPFTVSLYGTDFEMISWWEDEHFTVGVVLSDSSKLLLAIFAMHDYIITEWHKAVRDFRNGIPSSPDATHADETPYYDLDSLQSFHYEMALIMPVSVASHVTQYKIPEDLGTYVIR